MKNKFKKSKIIVPALALITATTVASVTGTVAWFTASRAVQVTASNFKTTSADGNLTVTATAGKGTQQKTGSTDTIDVTAVGMLDASYDGTNVWTDVPDTEKSYQKITSTDYKLGTTSKYYVVTWTYTFDVTVDSGVTSTYAIFLDPKECQATDSTSGSTMAGLRISFKDATASSTNRRLVLAPERETTTAATKGYVSSESQILTYESTPITTSAGSDKTYVFGKEYTKSGSSTWSNATGKVKNPSDRSDYIGTTAAPANNKASLTVNVVAWFEGLDDSIKNAENGDLPTMSTVSATLGFYAREVAEN